MHSGSGYSNWWWCAEACVTATAMCSTSPLVVIVIDGWWGRRRRIALFCDKLTNLGWLTLSVLKYLMKIKMFICETAWENNAIAWCFQLHLWMDFFLKSVPADNCKLRENTGHFQCNIWFSIFILFSAEHSSLQLDLDSSSTWLHCIALLDAGSHLLLKTVLGVGEGDCGAKTCLGLCRATQAPLWLEKSSIAYWKGSGHCLTTATHPTISGAWCCQTQWNELFSFHDHQSQSVHHPNQVSD